MYAYAARTSLECTSKTCREQAHFLRYAAAACRVFFEQPHAPLLLLAYTTAKVRSIYPPANSQPAQSEPRKAGHTRMRTAGEGPSPLERWEQRYPANAQAVHGWTPVELEQWEQTLHGLPMEIDQRCEAGCPQRGKSSFKRGR
jgi:hypothetical protein